MRRRGRPALSPLVVCAALGFASLAGVSCGKRAPAKAETLTLSVPYELETLDPHAKNRLSDFAILSNVYEPLVTTDGAMSIRPCLAERWDNPDLVTWVFHLRPGVRFHDGAPLTAADVVATFERLLASPDLEMGGYVWNIASARALDGATVELKTRAPMSILLNKLRFVLIVPAKLAAAGLQASASAVGTGPYRYATWSKGREIRLVRNDAYWGPRPAIASAVYLLGRKPEEALEDLTAGRSQLAQFGGKRLQDTARKNPDIELMRKSSIFVKFLAYDLKREKTPFVEGKNPFLDRRVREAIHLAIDRAALVARLSSDGVPASQLVPPFIFGFNPAIKEPRRDLARARALLAEAGYPAGFRVTLHVRKLFSDAAQHVSEMLAEAGIDVTLAELADPEFFRVVAAHESSFYLSRFGCPTGDASDILENGVHTIDLPRHFGRSNDGEYSNPKLDALIEGSAAILDMERRRPVLQGALAELSEDLALIPLYIDQDVYAVKKPFLWQPRNDNFLLAAEVGVGE